MALCAKWRGVGCRDDVLLRAVLRCPIDDESKRFSPPSLSFPQLFGITEVDLVSGLYVGICDGNLKGREYKLNRPQEVLMPPTNEKYRKSMPPRQVSVPSASSCTDIFVTNIFRHQYIRYLYLRALQINVDPATLKKYPVGSEWVMFNPDDSVRVLEHVCI